MTLSDSLRQKMDVQGFLDVENPEQAHWIKFSNFLCFVMFTIGTYLQSPLILFAMGPVAIAGLTYQNTIFDLFYNRILSPLLGKPEVPKRPAPARFACFVGLVWSATAASAFLVDATLVGLAFGWSLVLFSGLQGLRNYCVASVAWRKIYGWPDRD